MSLAQQRLDAAMEVLGRLEGRVGDIRSDRDRFTSHASFLGREAEDRLKELGLHDVSIRQLQQGMQRSTFDDRSLSKRQKENDEYTTDLFNRFIKDKEKRAVRSRREQQAEVEALENAARAEDILLGNADPRMRAALDTLQRQSEEGPYTEAVQNMIAGRSADSAAAAADSQNQMLMEQMARSGGSMSDAGIMAAQRAIESDRMLSNNAARRDIAIQAALQNYQGQQQAASQLAGLRSGANAQLANLYANATVESPNNQSAVRVAPQSFNVQAATAALPQKDSGSNGNDSSGGVKPVTEDELDEWQKYIDGNNMGGFIRPANPNDNRPMGPARPYSGPIDINNKGQKSVNINTKDLKGQLWGKPQAPGGVKSSDYRNTKPMARN